MHNSHVNNLAYIHIQVCKDSWFEQLCSSRVDAQGSHYTHVCCVEWGVKVYWFGFPYG